MKHTINGKAMCTLKGLDSFKKGEKVHESYKKMMGTDKMFGCLMFKKKLQ